MLLSQYTDNRIEAGCDEAGRGCLAGPVCAAAVILPKGYENVVLNDSKKLTAKQRSNLRQTIEQDALAWAVAFVDNNEIDEINILNASFLAMNKAIEMLSIRPELLLIDGNRFKTNTDIEFKCIVKGDGLYESIAAASVLAKWYRDAYMIKLHEEYPCYDWKSNKGYPTKKHYEAIEVNGITCYHRKSFSLERQLKIEFQ
ncbi:MAG: ribonuclease HII [Bacteroidales bacterium]|nr:ribonuclease HII [Bacteroidales bacterium]